MKGNAVPFSAPTPAPAKSAAQKNQEQHVRAAPAPAPTLVSETLSSITNDNENGLMQEAEGVFSFALLDLVVKSWFCLISSNVFG